MKKLIYIILASLLFFSCASTESEIETLSKRWRILEMLKDGFTQRDIAKELKVSLCKVEDHVLGKIGRVLSIVYSIQKMLLKI